MGTSGINRDVFKPPPERRSGRPSGFGLLLILIPFAVATAVFAFYKLGGGGLLVSAGNGPNDALLERIAQLEERVDKLEKGRGAVARQPRETAPAASSQPAAESAPQIPPRSSGKLPSALAPLFQTPSAPAAAAAAQRPAQPAPTGAQTPGPDSASDERWKATADRMGSVVGELGTQRREIARTHDQISTLASQLERRSMPFTLARGSRRQVGPVWLLLDRTDTKNQRYTLRLSTGDTTTLLKDRAVNEAVSFYLEKGEGPLDLIINHLGREQATGTLMLPASNTPPRPR